MENYERKLRKIKKAIKNLVVVSKHSEIISKSHLKHLNLKYQFNYF